MSLFLSSSSSFFRSFSASVRLWPGSTPSRRLLLAAGRTHLRRGGRTWREKGGETKTPVPYEPKTLRLLFGQCTALSSLNADATFRLSG